MRARADRAASGSSAECGGPSVFSCGSGGAHELTACSCWCEMATVWCCWPKGPRAGGDAADGVAITALLSGWTERRSVHLPRVDRISGVEAEAMPLQGVDNCGHPNVSKVVALDGEFSSAFVKSRE